MTEESWCVPDTLLIDMYEGHAGRSRLLSSTRPAPVHAGL